MKWTRRSLIELIASVLMIAVVLVLGTLQYRWTDEVSQSQQDRLQSVLTASVRNFNQDFSYDFERLCESFEILPVPLGSDVAVPVARQYANWYKSSSRREFVSGVYIWKFDGSRSAALLSIGPAGVEKASWPSGLASLHAFLDRRAADLAADLPDRQAEYYPWTFFPGTPAFVRPLFEISSDEAALVMAAKPTAFLIVQLDDDFLKRVYLPGLVDRDFSRMGFDAAIRTSAPPYEAVYLSTPSFPISTASPDASFNLFYSVGEEARRRGHPSVQSADPASQWQLVALHSSGSLDLAVASWRRRNLAISFGLLAILTGSLILVFSVAHRAQRFAELQMEFVSGVSHELFTPLAVINSAVENLADGVVDSPAKIAEYIAILRDQGRRLEALLGQVLQFASRRSSHPEFELRPIDIGEIVASTVTLCEPMLRDAGFTREREIPPDLPFVRGDADAVHQCVENLIGNAIKYGRAGNWISVRAGLCPSGSEIQVAVEDRGMGISPKELRKIFEPFYRAQAVREGQFRGVGLGLFLVKQMMESMQGSITVSSEIGRGTRFVLHFPVPSPAAGSSA